MKKRVKRVILLFCFFQIIFLNGLIPETSNPPILGESILERIQNEVSGSICFEHIRFLSTLHRIWGHKDYNRAAQYCIDKSKEYGLTEAKIEKFAIKTGKEHFWMHSTGGEVPWNCKGGELRLVSPYPKLITHYDSSPSTVAVLSRSTNTLAELIFVGQGDSEDDYIGKDVRGKIVLAENFQHDRVHELAVHRYGALGTILFHNRQGKYWESESIYWGRIYPWNKEGTKASTFSFSLSRSQGFFLKDLLEKGEKVVISAKIDAEIIRDGFFELATAIIPGSVYPEEEFIFYAHLDHPKPGSHDNASGDAVLLEIARTLSSLIRYKIIPPPKRTIRFMWIPHMSGLNMYLHRYQEKIGKIKGGCNVDSVGVDQAKFPTKFHVAVPPHSLPTYLTDITNNLVGYLNKKMDLDEDKLFSPEGSRNLFSTTLMPYKGRSDEYAINTRSLNIPSIYFYDDPIPPRHNQINFLEYIDRSNLRRICYLGAIISYTFTTLGEDMLPKLLNEIQSNGKMRLERELVKAKNAIADSDPENIHQSYCKGQNLLFWGIKRERGMMESLKEILPQKKLLMTLYSDARHNLESYFTSCIEQLRMFYERKCEDFQVKPKRESSERFKTDWEKTIPMLNSKVKGVPGYFSSFFEDTLGKNFLTKYPEVRPSYKYRNIGYYETLNYIDGIHTVADIYQALQAELWSEDYSPFHYLSFEEFSDYIRMLKDAGVIFYRKQT